MIEEFVKNNIVQYGDFLLKSGEKSSIYINLKKIISFPKLHGKISDMIASKITPGVDLICGTPYGAISYASIISIHRNIPMLFLRKEQKEYGNKNLIEGVYNKNDKVILIEDVITTGNSVIKTAKTLEDNGLKVIQIISIISRCENKNLKYNDIPIVYLYHIDEFVDNFIDK